MTTQADFGTIPDWTLGDRMAKALKSQRISVQDMAEYMGISRNTITNWTHDKSRPTRGDLRLWAMRTGVPLEWLETGTAPQPDGPEGGSTLPQVDSNHQPFGYQLAAVA